MWTRRLLLALIGLIVVQSALGDSRDYNKYTEVCFFLSHAILLIFKRTIVEAKIVDLITIAKTKIATTKITTSIKETLRITINARTKIATTDSTTITIAKIEIAMISNTMTAR